MWESDLYIPADPAPGAINPRYKQVARKPGKPNTANKRFSPEEYAKRQKASTNA